MRRTGVAALAAGSVLGAGMAAAVAGRLSAAAALRPTRRGTGPLPAGFEGPSLTVHRLTGGTEGEHGRIALTGARAALLPGVYGLAGRRCHAVVGPVLEEETRESAADTVVRRLERVTHGTVAVGANLRLTPIVHPGDPQTALGIECAGVDVPGELGALPAWFVPGDRDTWVIAVHGLGTTREQPTALLPFLRAQSLPVLVPGYRGDAGAPRPRDGIGHLGGSEWRDLDAAIDFAVRYGAERIILHGWSTGATMALYAAAESGLRRRIAGLVLDSPVLDPPATVRALAAARRTPAMLLPLAVRAAEGLARLDPERLATATAAGRLRVPVLVLHGPGDHIAPWQASRSLADRNPGLVTLHPVDNAPHAAMWNADPGGYEEVLRRFLTSLL